MNDNDKNREPEEYGFWTEIKRRHVAGTAIAYVVAAWAIIQVADVLGPAFNAPEWTVRTLTTVLILMFPLVVVLAWEYNITRRGVARVVGDSDTGITAKHWFRRSLVGLISLMSLGSIVWLWQAGFLIEEPSRRASDDFPKTVAVDEFEAFVDEDTRWIGDGVANLIRDNLSQSQYLRVTSARRWQAIAGESDDSASAAADADIRFLLQGEIIGNRSGFVLTVRLTDTDSGDQLYAQTYEVGEEDSLLERSTAVAQGVRARLNVPVQERVDVFTADYAADHPGAYRAFIGALDYWTNFDYQDAERLFRAALELEPDYAMARYYLAWTLTSQDRLDEAVGVLDEALASGTNSERDRHYIEALNRYIRRDVDGAVEAYTDLVTEYPNDTESRYLLGEALLMQGALDASVEQFADLAQLEPEIFVGWSGLGYALTQAGDFEAAREPIDRFAELAPDNPNVFVLRGDLNRATGNLDAAIDDYRTALDKGPDLQDAVVSLGRTQYLAGDTDAAIGTLRSLVTDESALPRYRISAAFELGGILNGLGRFREHIVALENITAVTEASGGFHAKALVDRAYARMMLGDVSADTQALVDDAIEQSPGVPTRYLFYRGLLELERGELVALDATAGEIRALSLPPDNPDRTEERAADYLLALGALARDDVNEALMLFDRIAAAGGYDYRDYGLDHARALLLAGRPADAEAILDSSVREPDRVAPRLDLELDRFRAFKLMADVLDELGRDNDAAAARSRVASQWEGADAGFVLLESR